VEDAVEHEALAFLAAEGAMGRERRLTNAGLIFREVTGKFDVWRTRCWRSGFKSDTIRGFLLRARAMAAFARGFLLRARAIAG
jgi:hypothetical protein